MPGVLTVDTRGLAPINKPPVTKKKGRSDGEAADAINNYFWGKSGGVVLEMGAINGNWTSESLPLVSRGWHRVLIEGNPRWRKSLMQWTDSFVYGAAVCESDRVVHYAVNRNYFVSGIVEFMTEDYLQQWYKRISALATARDGVFNISSVSWAGLKQVQEVRCLPMARILEHTGLKHINLMILDVEGAEIVALKSIDFTKVQFDVIIVEYNRKSELLEFFQGTDYNFDKKEGRNLWFVHKNFVRSVNSNQLNTMLKS